MSTRLRDSGPCCVLARGLTGGGIGRGARDQIDCTGHCRDTLILNNRSYPGDSAEGGFSCTRGSAGADFRIRGRNDKQPRTSRAGYGSATGPCPNAAAPAAAAAPAESKG